MLSRKRAELKLGSMCARELDEKLNVVAKSVKNAKTLKDALAVELTNAQQKYSEIAESIANASKQRENSLKSGNLQSQLKKRLQILS